MKKARTFLIALSVLTVVGGALAFKAKVPQQFAQCNLANLVCELNTTTLLSTTTAVGGQVIPYRELSKPCTFTQNVWTCTTRVTISD